MSTAVAPLTHEPKLGRGDMDSNASATNVNGHSLPGQYDYNGHGGSVAR